MLSRPLCRGTHFGRRLAREGGVNTLIINLPDSPIACSTCTTMARMTCASSEEDPRLVTPTKVGEDASESLFEPCRRKEPFSMSWRCSDGRNNDRTSRSQWPIGSKVVIQFATRTHKKLVAQYCVFRLAKGLTSGYEHLGDTNALTNRGVTDLQLISYGHVTRSKLKRDLFRCTVVHSSVYIYYPSCHLKYAYAINRKRDKLGKVYRIVIT